MKTKILLLTAALGLVGASVQATIIISGIVDGIDCSGGLRSSTAAQEIGLHLQPGRNGFRFPRPADSSAGLFYGPTAPPPSRVLNMRAEGSRAATVP